MIVCITGGTGFIGSHVCITLIESGHRVILLDNLSNSSVSVLDNIQNITGIKPDFYDIDIRDYDSLRAFFLQSKIDCVIHCAALKSISESTKNPLEYYENNITGTINLLKAMKAGNCYNLIFSSSATVYGKPEKIPLTEECKTNALNAYGRTKLYIEEILQDLSDSDPRWTFVMLRYFNPVGAHPSGKIGENPKGIPNNLFPYILQVAKKEQPYLTVYGKNYNTPDGTCIRDYIHISDLASGHLAALQKINEFNGTIIINLGTGQGYSVMQIITEMQKAIGSKIPYIIGPKRKGDAEICYAATTKAQELLGWKAEKTIEDMCTDAWRWYQTI